MTTRWSLAAGLLLWALMAAPPLSADSPHTGTWDGTLYANIAVRREDYRDLSDAKWEEVKRIATAPLVKVKMQIGPDGKLRADTTVISTGREGLYTGTLSDDGRMEWYFQGQLTQIFQLAAEGNKLSGTGNPAQGLQGSPMRIELVRTSGDPNSGGNQGASANTGADAPGGPAQQTPAAPTQTVEQRVQSDLEEFASEPKPAFSDDEAASSVGAHPDDPAAVPWDGVSELDFTYARQNAEDEASEEGQAVVVPGGGEGVQELVFPGHVEPPKPQAEPDPRLEEFRRGWETLRDTSGESPTPADGAKPGQSIQVPSPEDALAIGLQNSAYRETLERWAQEIEDQEIAEFEREYGGDSEEPQIKPGLVTRFMQAARRVAGAANRAMYAVNPLIQLRRYRERTGGEQKPDDGISAWWQRVKKEAGSRLVGGLDVWADSEEGQQ